MQVTIIGGGSYQWAPELMADLLSTPALRGCRLVLEDIDPEPLAVMGPLAEKMDEALEAKATIVTTTDQRQALEGADYVVVTISTGGFESMAIDLTVPERHGIRHSVGDTVGPAGISRALRNIPILVGVGQDMEELCPDAWLLNITNPMTCLTRSVCRETSVRTVGLCHEVGNFCIDLAIALQKPAEAIRPTIVGVNHFPVVAELDVDGRDGFEVLGELVDEIGGLAKAAPGPGAEDGEPFSKLDFAQRNFLKLSFLERWGTLAVAGDRHLAEFVPFVLTEESGWGAEWNVRLTTISDREGHQDEFTANAKGMLSGTKTLQTWQSGELPGPVIDSLITGERRELPVNIPNDGQCPDLPADAVVESICIVDGDGIRGRDVAHVSAPVTELLRRHVAVQEMTVEAALSGDRDLAEQAFVLDPLGGRGDLHEAEKMVGELLDETARWLPLFSTEGASTSIQKGGRS